MDFKKPLYDRWIKLHKVASDKIEDSNKFIGQVRKARNNLVHEGEVGRMISGRDSLRTPRPDLIRGLIVSISNLLKVAIGFGPIDQEKLLSEIDNANRRDIVDSLPEWCTENISSQDEK
ncbi:MAG: hypothetical protein P1Q69_15455 [Candidatus Thorarchaeota archaeon]|nr:hypothetical protein [Candidatus Thorarchaeota archaeon]